MNSFFEEREVCDFEIKVRKACEEAAVIASKPYKNVTMQGIVIEHYKNRCYERVAYPDGTLSHQYIGEVKAVFTPLVTNFVWLWRMLGGSKDSKKSYYLLISWTDALRKYFTKYHTFYKMIDLLGTEYNHGDKLTFEERSIMKLQLQGAMKNWFDTYKEGIDLDDYDDDFGIKQL